MNRETLFKFSKESLEIERMFRDPTDQEIDELKRFIGLPTMTVEELEQFVSVYQPDAKLRDKYDMNVRVGSYYPPFGNPEMRTALNDLLKEDLNAWDLHIRYELLHPFMDCNGRSGRALWLWKNMKTSGSFLLDFYFQTLSHCGNQPGRLWKQ